ncbi:hypothetical protein ANN_24737 [Periplaneta americana]|uniref:SGNH hydrolase-type esterase domain-containing protein n=1 Tax=Periplaneta americana TaxID=6978 RepID=A0ABQ8RZF8_PERAM|nr:hypothetical protein ANN_24737 [Periplaneta americana]
MAGLCEGGNEPAGFLKAIFNCPNTDLKLISDNNKASLMSVLGRANKAFEWVEEQLGTRYVDSNSWLDDRDFRRDGVHLNQRGTAAMGALFARVAATTREDRSQQ